MTKSLNENQSTQYWAIIPAAGVGKRMQADRPKQYLDLHGKTVIEHTLDRLLSMNEIVGVVLSISEGDEYWPGLNYQTSKPMLIAEGGKERSDSVLNALNLLNEKVDKAESVFALVHDAARPCVRTKDIQKLIERGSDENGGLLALAVRDTMKRSDSEGNVLKTVARNNLWHALTPQMFRLDLLISALQNAEGKQLAITDDTSAMELAGYTPKLIEAHEDNIKITRAFDLTLSELYLNQQTK
jgi:2-C-methyl-D-erythritol 4-phosphate cytidylyltransferase